MQILEELWKNDLQLEKPFIHNRQYAECRRPFAVQ